jgi:putative endonuclease
LGEELASRELKKRGYRILGTNYRCRHGEIDIIAVHRGCLVFVEVRSKSSASFGTPAESVTQAKKRKLSAAAMDYLAGHDGLPDDWRIDFVAVELDPAGQGLRAIEIIENALG